MTFVKLTKDFFRRKRIANAHDENIWAICEKREVKGMQTFHILWYNESIIHTDNFDTLICYIFLFEIKRV